MFHALSAGRPLVPGITLLREYAKPAPLHVTDLDIQMYLGSVPLTVSLVESGAAEYRDGAAPGWAAYEDVNGKRGFIANATGAVAVWSLPPSLVTQHVRIGRMHVALLTSYEKMGRLGVTLHAGLWDSAARTCAPGAELASTLIDGLSVERVSVTALEEVSFDQAPLHQGTDTCMRVAATVMNCSPPRTENKVKLISFVLY